MSDCPVQLSRRTVQQSDKNRTSPTKVGQVGKNTKIPGKVKKYVRTDVSTYGTTYGCTADTLLYFEAISVILSDTNFEGHCKFKMFKDVLK